MGKKLIKIIRIIAISLVAFFLMANLAIILFGHYTKNVSFVDLMLSFMPYQTMYNSPNILVIGIDETDDVHRSDAIMFFKIHSYTKKVNIISIPRDSYVYIAGRGFDKINHAFAYGGVPLLKLAVEDLLSERIDRYLVLSLEDVKQIVEALGTLEIDVEQRMKYTDRRGNLYIDLQPGLQRLNAEQAMGYARFRHTYDADIGRTKRQQKLIQAIFNEASSPENLLKIPGIISRMRQEIDTDLSLKELVWVGGKIKKSYDNHQFFQTTLKGLDLMIGGISYWDIDKNYMQEALSKAKIAEEIHIERLPKFNVNIEILNGNGIPGCANKFAKEVEKAGLNVVNMKNADRFDYSETFLLLNRDNKNLKNDFEKYFGKNTVKIIRINDPDISAMLVLGQDWENILEKIKKFGH